MTFLHSRANSPNEETCERMNERTIPRSSVHTFFRPSVHTFFRSIPLPHTSRQTQTLTRPPPMHRFFIPATNLSETSFESTEPELCHQLDYSGELWMFPSSLLRVLLAWNGRCYLIFVPGKRDQ